MRRVRVHGAEGHRSGRRSAGQHGADREGERSGFGAAVVAAAAAAVAVGGSGGGGVRGHAPAGRGDAPWTPFLPLTPSFPLTPTSLPSAAKVGRDRPGMTGTVTIAFSVFLTIFYHNIRFLSALRTFHRRLHTGGLVGLLSLRCLSVSEVIVLLDDVIVPMTT